MKLPAICLLLFVWASTSIAQDDWKSYTNARFGFRLAHPASLLLSRAPDNGGGQEFHTKNKEFSISAFGHFLPDGESLATMWTAELKDLGETVTYKKKGETWFVVSGVKDGTEYYHKTFVQGGNWVSFQITYPHEKAKQYDPWVERIAKEFVPFLEGDFDRITK